MAQAQQYSASNNMAARAAVLQNSVTMKQGVFTGTIPAPNLGSQTAVQLRNVGLNKRIVLEINATITSGAGETLQLTPWGLANFFSNVTLTDLNNYQRINTTGWHLHALACLRRSMPFGAAQLIDAPMSIGSNAKVMYAPPVIPPATAVTVRMFYELPLAYNDLDLRGSVYAAAVNSTWQVQYTVNGGMFVGSAGDPTLGVYKSDQAAALATLTLTQVKVTQVYLDQIPFDGGSPVLPLFDLATMYLLQNTNNTGLVANQDFPIQFANFRQFLSTVMIYNNGGTLNPGTDINYLGIQAANLVFTEQVDAFYKLLETRDLIGDDFPNGTYVFNTRNAPINTAQFGQQQLVLNASTVNANATVYTGYEMLAIQNQAINAGSLPAN